MIALVKRYSDRPDVLASALVLTAAVQAGRLHRELEMVAAVITR